MSFKYLLFFIFSSTFIFTNCSKPAGCIDKRALNYDPTIQVANASCTYPSLSLQFDFKVDSLPFEINRIYQIDGRATAFKIMQLYLSKIQLTRTDQSIANYDSLYPLLKKENNKVPLGEVYVESYERLQFKVGIPAVVNNQIAHYLYNPQHPLRLQTTDTMHFNTNDGYIFMRIEGKVDRNGDGIPNENESFDFRIGSNQLLQSVNLSLQKDIQLAQETIPVVIDVAQLIQNVDLQTEQHSHTFDNLPLASKIANNIANAFYIP